MDRKGFLLAKEGGYAMSHLMYDLLDGLQEGIHAYLDTHPDTEPQTLLVKIEITDDEVTVERIDCNSMAEREDDPDPYPEE